MTSLGLWALALAPAVIAGVAWGMWIYKHADEFPSGREVAAMFFKLGGTLVVLVLWALFAVPKILSQFHDLADVISRFEIYVTIAMMIGVLTVAVRSSGRLFKSST